MYGVLFVFDCNVMGFVDFFVVGQGFVNLFDCFFIQYDLMFQNVIKIVVIDDIDISWVGLLQVFDVRNVLGWERGFVQYVEESGWILCNYLMCFFQLFVGGIFFQFFNGRICNLDYYLCFGCVVVGFEEVIVLIDNG